jgi:hypothetical protein
MKDLDQVKDYFPGDTMSSAVMKVQVVSKALDGGFHVDLTLANGSIVEAMVGEEKLKMVEERIFEDVFFIVKPLEANRYECTCMVFGKTPEYKH